MNVFEALRCSKPAFYSVGERQALSDAMYGKGAEHGVKGLFAVDMGVPPTDPGFVKEAMVSLNTPTPEDATLH